MRRICALACALVFGYVNVVAVLSARLLRYKPTDEVLAYLDSLG
jgi:hypothetical protein